MFSALHSERPKEPRSKAQRRAATANSLRANGQRRPPGGFQKWELKQLTRLPMAPGIRIRTRRDGFGAQYLAQMSALAWAAANNRFYYYEPFSYLDHGEDASDLSIFTGLRHWGSPAPYKSLSRIRFVPEVLASERPSTYFTKGTTDILREMYTSTPKPADCPHNIAIHIRRGDVTKDMKGRWISGRAYTRMIRILRGFFPQASIGIYSLGDPKDFQGLTKYGVKLELNRNIKETFHELVTAPLLIPAPSCLSYAAALISNKAVLHIANQQNRPLDHWIHTRILGESPRRIRKLIGGRLPDDQDPIFADRAG